MTTPSTPAGESERGPEGVDRTLIRWMLSLSPAERLQFLEQQMEGIEEARARHGQ